MAEINRLFRRSLPFLPDPDKLYELFRSKNRARVYFYLLQYSPQSVMLMSKILKLKWPTVYNAVISLKKMGLIEERGTIRNGRYGKDDGRSWGLARETTLWGIALNPRIMEETTI